MADSFELPLLGRLPLAMDIRTALDEGNPSVSKNPDSAEALSYRKLALRTAGALAMMPRSMTFKMPEIVVSN
jgi:ATP-binding protein involved in chromosome partitioning